MYPSLKVDWVQAACHRENALELVLHRNLHDAWGVCRGYESEGGSIVPVAVRIVELRVIEDVEGFRAELRRLAFVDMEIPQQGKIGVIQAGPVEEPALRRDAAIASSTVDIPTRDAPSVAAMAISAGVS